MNAADPGVAPAPPVPITRRCWACGHLPEPGQPAQPCERCDEGDAPAERPRGPGPVAGLGAVFAGLRFLNRNPRLWSWIFVPLILNAGIFFSAFLWSRGYIDALVPEMTTEWWAWIDWLRVGLASVVPVLMQIVAFMACLIVTLLLSGIVNAPFYDILSEKTEATRLGRPEVSRPWSKFISDQWRSVGAALILAARQIVVLGILFLLSFTAIGAPFFVLAGFFFTGYAMVDVPLARKRYTAGERIRWGRRHMAHLVGVGLPINLLPPLAPLGIVGATLAYLDTPDKG